MIGPPGSGKTTALLHSGPALSARHTAQELQGRRRHAQLRLVLHRRGRAARHRRPLHDPGQRPDGGRGGLAGLPRAAASATGRASRSTASSWRSRAATCSSGERRRHRRRRAPSARRLAELEQRLGLRLPVYLLLTKADLVAGFGEFFADLDEREREQVWGFTLPARPGRRRPACRRDSDARSSAGPGRAAGPACTRDASPPSANVERRAPSRLPGPGRGAGADIAALRRGRLRRTSFERPPVATRRLSHERHADRHADRPAGGGDQRELRPAAGGTAGRRPATAASSSPGSCGTSSSARPASSRPRPGRGAPRSAFRRRGSAGLASWSPRSAPGAGAIIGNRDRQLALENALAAWGQTATPVRPAALAQRRALRRRAAGARSAGRHRRSPRAGRSATERFGLSQRDAAGRGPMPPTARPSRPPAAAAGPATRTEIHRARRPRLLSRPSRSI